MLRSIESETNLKKKNESKEPIMPHFAENLSKHIEYFETKQKVELRQVLLQTRGEKNKTCSRAKKSQKHVN